MTGGRTLLWSSAAALEGAVFVMVTDSITQLVISQRRLGQNAHNGKLYGVTTSAYLPLDERLALHEEVKELINSKRYSQTTLARELGFSQAAISKVYNAPEIGPGVAKAFYERFGVSAETLIAKHNTRTVEPLSVEARAISFRGLLDWFYGTTGVKRCVDEHPDVTVDDLLRYRAEPARHGDADPDEVYRHIQQLRKGPIGTIVPSVPIATDALEKQMTSMYESALRSSPPPRRTTPPRGTPAASGQPSKPAIPRHKPR